MKKLTSSIYSFERLRQENYFYVDKTEYLWKLIQNVGESYFLARPRRFGKSLTVSTLKAIFEGKRHLFEGLAIDNKEYDWKTYPVIHLDMGSCMAKTAEELKTFLSMLLSELAEIHQVQIPIDKTALSSSFEILINRISKTEKVVILIDEYDKPILGNIGTPDADAVLEVLKGFYSAIKTCNDKERFVFITGVSKFSHVSMFSGFNNPTDISMRTDFATMLGYTQNEFETGFAECIDLACQKTGMERQELLKEIKLWYNGYRFTQKSETVYNPVSLANFFENDAEFNNYWFATGTPSFLMKLAKEKNFSIEDTLNEPVPSFTLDAFEIDKVDLLTLLLQTGYLTIKSSEQIFRKTWYRLGFPNLEVEDSFNTWLLRAYTSIEREVSAKYLIEMARSVKSGDAEKFMDCIKTYFADIPYDIQLPNEKYYQSVFYLLFRNLSLNIDAEVKTNNGRIDAFAEEGNNVYIFEFKIDQSAEIALNQIKEKEYFQKFKHSGKEITLIGATFNTKTRQLADWEIDKV